MKRIGLILMLAWVAVCAYADAPNGSGAYYKRADGKKGAALKTALCGIIYDRTELTYKYLWTAYHRTDLRNDGKIWDMYSNATNYEPGGSAQGATFHGEGDSYNREHSFPKSWFGGEVMPMFTDLHHLYPVDGYINDRRSNFPYGETNGETYKSANNFSKLGTCTYSGYTGKVFEPADEYKGDLARTYFYMVTCYEEKLHDWVTNFGSSTEVDDVLDGNTYPGLTSWQLSMLMKWAKNDPVSDKEVARNNEVYAIQGNRNPFIDYPGLEEYIWGTKTDVAFSYDEQGSGETEVVEETVTFTPTTINGTKDGNTQEADQMTSGCVTIATTKGQFGRNTDYRVYKDATLTITTSEGSITNIVFEKNGSYDLTKLSADNYSNGTWTGSATIVRLTASEQVRMNSIAVTIAKEPSLLTPSTYSTTTTLAYGTPFTLVNGSHFTTDGTVTLHSSNQEVASVSGLTVTPVAVGTTTIHVSYAEGETYAAATSEFTLTVTAPQGQTQAPGNAPLTETWDRTNGTGGNDGSWNGSIATNTVYSDNDGWVYENVGGASKCLKVGTGSKKGIATTPAFGRDGTVVVTFKAAAWNSSSEQTTLVLYLTGDGTLDQSSVTLTKGAFTSYSVNVTGATSATTLSFAGKNASNSRFFLDDVIISSPPHAIEVTLNSSGYATFCSEYPLDFSDHATADYSAWTITGVRGTTISFAKVTGSVKGGTGLLLKGAAGATVTLNSTSSSTTADGNLLHGTLAPTFINANEYYGLSGKNFVKVNAGTVPAGKAILPASAIPTNVKAFTFAFNDLTTEVVKLNDNDDLNDNLNVNNNVNINDNSPVYDLSGRRLQSSIFRSPSDASRLKNLQSKKKGIYIINGKRVLVR